MGMFAVWFRMRLEDAYTLLSKNDLTRLRRLKQN